MLIGYARFIDPQTIELNGKHYTSRIFILCTGSSPRELEIPCMEGIPIFNNETLFYECQELPAHLVVIGVGPLGCDMAQAF